MTDSTGQCPCVDGLPDPCTLCGAPADGICGLDDHTERIREMGYKSGWIERQVAVDERDDLIFALCKGGYAGSSNPLYFSIAPGFGVTLTREQRDLVTKIMNERRSDG